MCLYINICIDILVSGYIYVSVLVFPRVSVAVCVGVRVRVRVCGCMLACPPKCEGISHLGPVDSGGEGGGPLIN